MARKLKFRPVIARIALNPEQALLSCNCYQESKKPSTEALGYVGSTPPSIVQMCTYFHSGPERVIYRDTPECVLPSSSGLPGDSWKMVLTASIS